MAFLNPFVLFGLAAAAIPVLIHLFNFRKPKRVDFSSLAFVRELRRSTMRRVRIRQWILLLLRTAAIVCLVLAFARPTLQGPLAGAFGGQASTSAAIVVDNSLSMTLRDREGRLLDQAINAAREVFEQMNTRDEVYLYPGTPAFESAGGRELLSADAITAIEARAGAGQIDQQLTDAAERLRESALPNHELYLLSDLQSSTFPDSVSITFPSRTRIFLLPFGERATDNAAVSKVSIDSRIIEAGQPVEVSAAVRNYASTPIDDAVVSLSLDGKRLAQAALNVDASSERDVTFTVVPDNRGQLPGVIRLEADAFPHDDVRYFVLHVPERRRILLVRGAGSESTYLELALGQQLETGQSAFDLQVISEGDLPATQLSSFDAIVLSGLSSAASSEAARLSSFVENGGGLLLFAGSAEGDDDLLSALGAGQPGGRAGEPGSGLPIARLEQADMEHPVFRGIFDRSEPDARRLEQPDVYAYLNYRAGSGEEQTIASLSNGRPFVQEVKSGQGAALVVLSAPEPGWSDLPVRGLFIPLVYRSLYYLTVSGDSSMERFILGRSAAVRLDGRATGNFMLQAPGGATFAMEQRTHAGGITVQVPADLSKPGVYTIVDGADRPIRRIAVNMAPEESDLERLTPTDAATRLERIAGVPVAVREPGDTTAIASMVSEARFGVELWRPFLLAALLLLILEMLVGMRWRPESQPSRVAR